MTTAVTAKVAIAGKSVVSKRNVAAAPSKRGQLVRARSFSFLLAFSARRRRGAILFLAALCGIFSKKILAHTLFCAFTRNECTHLCAHIVIQNASQKEMRDRIASVGSTKKITDAMKLVAAAKVRKAQDAVINARPFSEQLVKVLFAINGKLQGEDVDAPLCAVRPVKTCLIMLCTGDRGLCGGYNNFAIKKCETRVQELEEQGVKCKLILVGKKANTYFKRRPQYTVVKGFNMGQSPTTQEAQAVADEIYSEFVGEEVDKVELVYSKFVSLIASEPIIQTLLPLSKEGEVCNSEGQCIDAKNDEIFRLTSEDGQLVAKSEKVETETAQFEGVMQFEQEPNQILDSIMPLYMNGIVLRALQESLASELAARMNAMANASDNAKDLKNRLNKEYNQKRQAKITSEIIELVAGASAL
ncbi:F0F1 ATP synthase subunit gamma [Bathycoccus prasinos]|uniref:F-ATPase gamma subunit n=1 Tax=Bathycoccus prasinos TaxID=41875 RepID=K8EAA1_9CHLO|nr:F0F1 ATP synthase subunit gamma [Bathycoccus prasinos]CCO14752.1 F0F1 ATP synthase subunit gamma [Bathycoccus prasinos]|eukprot:XP_007514512.1 F0F1 ATP synthase subunit gamma [Bathycoccus prasinos]